MKIDDGLPWISRSKRALGVVIDGPSADIKLNAAGKVSPEGAGISVAPDDPSNLPQHRRPAWVEGVDAAGHVRYGDSHDPLWRISADAVSDDLMFVQTDEQPPHGVLQPAREMTLAEYEEALPARHQNGSWFPRKMFEIGPDGCRLRP